MVPLHAHSIAVCTRPCQNGGQCAAPNVCTCRSGWTGAQCERGMLVAYLGAAMAIASHNQTYGSVSARLSTTTYCRPRRFELSTIRVTSESGGVNDNTRKCWTNDKHDKEKTAKRKPFPRPRKVKKAAI